MPRHTERRILPYRPRQMFDLVGDVGKYPEFLPWCLASRVTSRRALGPAREEVVADLIIGFKMFRERFTSRVALDTDALAIDVAYVNGPMKHLTNRWLFVPHGDGCEIDFFVDFEFRSRLLQMTIEMLFHEAVKRMVGAFEGRARQLYGPPGA